MQYRVPPQIHLVIESLFALLCPKKCITMRILKCNSIFTSSAPLISTSNAPSCASLYRSQGTPLGVPSDLPSVASSTALTNAPSSAPSSATSPLSATSSATSSVTSNIPSYGSLCKLLSAFLGAALMYHQAHSQLH